MWCGCDVFEQECNVNVVAKSEGLVVWLCGQKRQKLDNRKFGIDSIQILRILCIVNKTLAFTYARIIDTGISNFRWIIFS